MDGLPKYRLDFAGFMRAMTPDRGERIFYHMGAKPKHQYAPQIEVFAKDGGFIVRMKNEGGGSADLTMTASDAEAMIEAIEDRLTHE